MFKCTSCGIDVINKLNFVRFLCPSCGKAEIVRCSSCKALSNKYTCPNEDCKFVGP